MTRPGRHRGCLLCKPHKRKRGHGQADRKTWNELKQLGKKRRVSRHEITES